MTNYATNAAREIEYLNIGDGPDGIRIYSSEERAIVDSGSTMVNGLYVDVSTMNGFARFGPMLPSLIEQLSRHRSARDVELEREFRQHEELAAECERAGTDYSKGRAQGIREVIHYARLALAGRKNQPMDNADKKRIIEATADWENGMRQREAATDSPLPQTTEFDRRVYYQDLVYAACNTLDRLLKLRICCGTANSPTSEFRDALKLLTDRFMELAAEHAATMPIYSPPTDAGEQVRELRWRASYAQRTDRLSDCLAFVAATATIERLTKEVAAAKAERDAAVKVIERLDDAQLESLRTRFNQLGDEAQPGSVLDRFLDDVEACICASELARDFLSKQEGK